MLTNETLHTLETRRSCRAYLDRQVDAETLDAVLQAGTFAPTGMGRQSPVIVAVQDKAARDELSRMNAAVMGSDGDPFYGAPTVLVVLADTACGTYQYDGSLVMGNLLNAAASLGLGSCWIHRAKEVFATAEGKALLQNGACPTPNGWKASATASSAIPRRKGEARRPAQGRLCHLCALKQPGSLASGPTCASPPAWSAACSARRFCTASFRRRSRRCSPRAAVRPAGRPPPPTSPPRKHS